MKKIFALFIVLTMVFTLAACGDKPSGDRVSSPQSSGSGQSEGTGGDEGSNSNQDSNKSGGLAWPSADYITPGMEYTGAGEVLFAQNLPAAGMNGGELESTFVYINGGDWDSVKAYVDALKADGFSWYSKVDEPEPEFEFSYGTYTWFGEADGGARFIAVTLTEEAVEYGGIGLCNLTVDMLNGNRYTN